MLEAALANKAEREDLLIEIDPLLDLNQFDWSNWPARRTLTTPAAVASASVEDCYKLLTSTIRGERFAEGTIENAFDREIISAIANRLKSTL